MELSLRPVLRSRKELYIHFHKQRQAVAYRIRGADAATQVVYLWSGNTNASHNGEALVHELFSDNYLFFFAAFFLATFFFAFLAFLAMRPLLS